MLQLGDWELQTINGGRFWLDGGVMYGVVPRSIWQTVTPPDALNRIPLAIQCVFARNGRNTVLIDTGYGNKLSQLDRSAHAIEAESPLFDSLAAVGVAAESIDIVVLSHLHWDHVGGATQRMSDRRVVPSFPNATYFVNRLEWEDAASGAPELTGSYNTEDFAALEAAGQLVLTDGDVEVVPGLRTKVTGGHTRGHQALVLESNGEVALYPGDLCPDIFHLRRLWCSAYDLYPLETRRRKPELMGAAAEHAWWILWDHEPTLAASKLERHKSREFVVREARPEL